MCVCVRGAPASFQILLRWRGRKRRSHGMQGCGNRARVTVPGFQTVPPEVNARQAGPPPRRLPWMADKRGGVLRSNYKRDRGRFGVSPQRPRRKNGRPALDLARCLLPVFFEGPGEATGGPRDTLLAGNSRMRFSRSVFPALDRGCFGGGRVYAKVLISAWVSRAHARIGQGEMGPPPQGP